MTQLSLFDPPRQRHSPTSVAAAESFLPLIGTYRRKVLDAIRAAKDGLTDNEGIEATGINASTWRPRRIELLAAKLIADSGRTRKTESGREAVVWKVKE